MDIETLKKMANNKQNWRERLEAVEILKNINSIQFQVMCFQMPEKNFQQKR